jgi:transcriptional regulator of NAD metabolism
VLNFKDRKEEEQAMAETRRQQIIEMLKRRGEPITGADLSKKFQVSRQVIVQDIALIRAQGYQVLATSNGYIIPKEKESTVHRKSILCKHGGYDEMERELTIMVDAGIKIIDVIVHHPLYGRIRKALNISSRMDVEDFMRNVRKDKAEPLSALTGGEHMHTVEIPNDRAFQRMIEDLKEKGFFVKEEESPL